VVLTVRRIEFSDFDLSIGKHLRKTDMVTLEATSNAWHLYNKLVPLVASVTVANPMQIALIAKTLVKTEPRDALMLARLLAAGILATVWVPPAEVRESRALGGHRSRLIKQRTQARNRLRAVLFAHNVLSSSRRGLRPRQPGLEGGTGPARIRKTARAAGLDHPRQPRAADQRG
jgi:transposase